MTITIQLPPEIERLVTARAAERGQDVKVVVSELIERGIRTDRSLDEILAPFRAQVDASGLTGAELDSLFEEARKEVSQAQADQGP